MRDRSLKHPDQARRETSRSWRVSGLPRTCRWRFERSWWDGSEHRQWWVCCLFPGGVARRSRLHWRKTQILRSPGPEGKYRILSCNNRKLVHGSHPIPDFLQILGHQHDQRNSWLTIGHQNVTPCMMCFPGFIDARKSSTSCYIRLLTS